MASVPPNIKFVYHTIIFIFFVALSLKLFTWLLFLISPGGNVNIMKLETFWVSHPCSRAVPDLIWVLIYYVK